MENEVITEETIEETLSEIDGRTSLGKRLKAMEDTLTEHEKRIAACEVRR